tara:strand:- start:1389 stop:2942 length:1554 start_codon:yes stop_codon:yes gene_type:complete
MSASTNPNESSQMTAPSGGGGGSSGGVPDLMKIGSIPVNTVQEVETAILEPVVRSDTFARFVLPNKGLLHSHSKVEIGLTNSAQEAIIPVGIGAYAFIRRVALKIGNQTICEIDDFNHYYAYRSLFVANENQKEREQMTTGRAVSHQFAYQNRTAVATDGAAATLSGGGESNAIASGLGLDNGRDSSQEKGEGDLGAGILDGTNYYEPNTWQLTKQPNAMDTNLYQLSLSELCPFLRHNQIPLYLIKEQVALELTFSGVGDANFSSERVALQAGQTQKTGFPINTTDLRMISDHIFYPQELMLQYAQANSVLNFTYADYRLSKYSVAQADAKKQMIRNVGGAGRIVNKLIWGIQNEGTGGTEDNLLNAYSSYACAKDYTPGHGANTSQNGTATFNIKYNDTFEFPIDVKNPARHFHNVNQAEGMVPFVTREEYSNEGESLTTRKFLGRVQNTELDGRFFHLSQRLTSQERINSRGIELYFRYDGLPTAPGTDYTQRVFLEVMRTATIQNGYTECYFA